VTDPTTIVAIVSVVGGFVGIAAGLLAIRRHFFPKAKARIVSPSSQSENAGRYVTVLISVPDRRRRFTYWIAIQPSDCRGDGLWWPQKAPLNFDANGSASLNRVRLGRVGKEAIQDVGATFTVGLFEVAKFAHGTFTGFAARDERMSLPAGCSLVDSVEIRRVRF
jgi:hypothetical protein